ncbi:MAG TPA: phosphoesterase, partial [Dysgonomonas sp.]|nr:phosphoesterase [Dysgonomonas sp.]
MKKMLGYLVFCNTLFFLACDMIEYHPYDGRISGSKNINRQNIQRIETACEGKKTIRYAFLSDTQRHYDETEACVNHINQREDIDFVIHGGDISDFGMTKEFMWMRDIMNK